MPPQWHRWLAITLATLATLHAAGHPVNFATFHHDVDPAMRHTVTHQPPKPPLPPAAARVPHAHGRSHRTPHPPRHSHHLPPALPPPPSPPRSPPLPPPPTPPPAGTHPPPCRPQAPTALAASRWHPPPALP